MADKDDFGFSFEEEVVFDASSIEEAQKEIETLKETVEAQRVANRNMYRKICSLLFNLKKSPEKPTIKWPDRAAKIDAFVEELEQYKI